MTGFARVTIVAGFIAAAAGCGQQGPLVLPESARPIERIDAPAAEPEQDDDERQDEQ
jgi:predicted small lipoprotein YifL